MQGRVGFSSQGGHGGCSEPGSQTLASKMHWHPLDATPLALDYTAAHVESHGWPLTSGKGLGSPPSQTQISGAN